MTDVYLKIMNIHTMLSPLHPTANVSARFVSANKRRGRRGLLSVEEVINTEERNINLYAS